MSSSKRRNDSLSMNSSQQPQSQHKRQSMQHEKRGNAPAAKTANESTATSSTTADATTTVPSTTTNTDEPSICKQVVAGLKGRNKSMGQGKSNILEEMLYPYKVDDFLDKSFRKQAVHVQWSRRCRIETARDTSGKERFPNAPILQDIMDNPEVESLARETSSESIFVWLSKQRQPEQPPKSQKQSNGSTEQTSGATAISQGQEFRPPLIQSIEISDVETAIKLHTISGHALYFRAPPQLEQPLVASLLSETGFGCGQYDHQCDEEITTKATTTLGRGEVEIFVGGRNENEHPNKTKNCNFITGWHYDFQENFTIQISGVKRWTLHRGLVNHPLRGCTPHYDVSSSPESMSVMESQVLASRLANESLLSPTSMVSSMALVAATTEANVEIIDMYPGDVLYFPAGMWHTVETIESGISMNVSLMAANYATVTCQALQHFLLRNNEWRQCIQNRRWNSTKTATGAVEQLQQLLQSLPNILQQALDNNELNAQMILPPALYDPLVDEDSETDDDEDAESDQGDNISTSSSVVNVCDLILPDMVVKEIPVAPKWPFQTHRLFKNPLATLLHEENEIRNCFTNFLPFQSDQYYNISPPTAVLNNQGRETYHNTSQSGIYVLNVNFAGNEGHESMIRKRLRMTEQMIQEVHDYVDGTKRRSSSILRDDDIIVVDDDDSITTIKRWIFSDIARQHINCLVYYGYLIWEKG